MDVPIKGAQALRNLALEGIYDAHTLYGSDGQPDVPVGPPAPIKIMDGGEDRSGDPTKRWAVLTGVNALLDPLSSGGSDLFRIKASEFIRAAESCPPHSPKPTASDFASWVYSIYALGNENKFKQGIERKNKIFQWRPSKLISEKMLGSSGDWSLIYEGIEDSFPWDHPKYFEIPKLVVAGVPMRASPDLVYRHKKTHAVFIVSLGFTQKSIPSNLWPDVWAQLWAYAQIPKFNDSKLTVVGEIWGEDRSHLQYFSDPHEFILRDVVRRDPRAANYDRFFSRLFNIYSGALN